MSDIVLSAEQEAQAKRLEETLSAKFQEEARGLARLFASRPDAELLGKTEFEVRDRLHALGAQIFETALNERKKGGTKARALHAPSVESRPDL